ncbi:lysoplasmalogenase [Melissospora conviva]|uniref:lysoplasmalogenase n=1 Tax=Melissospora conviva TaxID=3388432 RepID=UPI003B7E15A3
MSRSRVALLVFAVAVAVNLTANAVDATVAVQISKPLLMPALAAYLWFAAREKRAAVPVVVLVALAASTAGDVALLGDGTGWFLAGMVFFLGAHIAYLVAFARGGALGRLRRPPLVAVPIGYAVATAAALTWMWPGLSAAGLAVPVAGYACALAAMATCAAAYGPRVAVGGGLFLVSDLLIAVGVADVATLPGPPIWVMATYTAGQFLLVTGWAARLSAAGPPSITPAVSPAATR